MNPEQSKAWAEPYREVVEELVQMRFGASYVTKVDLDLDSVADSGPWVPGEFIESTVTNLKDIEVVLITNDTNLNDINKDLIRSKIIGLVLMGPVINRTSKPSLLLMTTKRHIYVIEPDDINRGIQFLKMKLNDKNLTFWTTSGINEADCLLHNYNINLQNSQAKCCSGLHIHLMQAMQYMEHSALTMYPALAIQKCKLSIRIEKFEDLVETWLDIDKRDFSFNACQIPHLKTRPLSQTALNLIKKRCVLVRPLARKLQEFSWLEVRVMSDNSFDRLASCNKNIRRDEILLMKRCKSRNVFDTGYIAHVDLGKRYEDLT